MKCVNCGHHNIKTKTTKFPDEEGRKMCSTCKEVKDLSEFDKVSPKKSDNIRADCKNCRKIRNAEYYKNKKKVVKKRPIITEVTEEEQLEEIP